MEEQYVVLRRSEREYMQIAEAYAIAAPPAGYHPPKGQEEGCLHNAQSILQRQCVTLDECVTLYYMNRLCC